MEVCTSKTPLLKSENRSPSVPDDPRLRLTHPFYGGADNNPYAPLLHAPSESICVRLHYNISVRSPCLVYPELRHNYPGGFQCIPDSIVSRASITLAFQVD
jgi:hypothetical protein